jgi:hopanoid biosynthesis associated protein HpnK
MPPRLILNADDFGLTPGINRAIAELHAAGALTSATLMATGPAFDDAICIALAQPTLGVGCHIVLTDGTPVSPPENLPTLCPNGRTFRPALAAFHRAVFFGQLDPSEIEREATAQIQKLQHAGIHITHLDTHKHTHIFPTVARTLLHAAQHNDISAIRTPFEPPWSIPLSGSNLMQHLKVQATRIFEPRFLALPQIHSHAVRTTDGTIGISATGDLTPATLRRTLESLPATGTYELLCHPGYNDTDLDTITTRLRHHREIELQALLSELPKILANPNPPALISYAAL